MDTRIFPAKTDELANVLSFAEEKLESFGASMKTVIAVTVAIEEVFVNVARYAYPDGEGDAVLAIGFDEKTRKVTFCLSDRGIPFDPLKKQDPDITLSAEERDIGGLGIFITRKTMDEVSYTYQNGENQLTMIKTI